METRSIAIGLVAVVAAFAAAFGVAKSGGSETATAGAGAQAETIKVASPAVAGVEVGGTLPALKAERKAKKKKGSSGSNTSSSTTPSATVEPSMPSTNDTTPPATNNTTPPATNNTTPPVSKPKPQPEEPASGGGEDG
jgi:hypothetical protein